MNVSFENLMLCIKSNITSDMYDDLKGYINQLQEEAEHFKKQRDTFREGFIAKTESEQQKDYIVENQKRKLEEFAAENSDLKTALKALVKVWD